jgi:hypothetical protein
MTVTEPSEDMEAQPRNTQKKSSHWQLVIDQTHVTPEVINWPYKGSGTSEDPYVVVYIENDRRNPMLFSKQKKWAITIIVAIVSSIFLIGNLCVFFEYDRLKAKQATLAVSLLSSAYTGGIDRIISEFDISDEVAVLGVSLFVLGFAVGPLLWAPMSELYGRQILFFGTYAALTAFNAGAAGSQNIQTLLILRFFAGAFGSSPLTNAGGVIADMFPASDRGLAMSIFAAAPFLGPIIGLVTISNSQLRLSTISY